MGLGEGREGGHTEDEGRKRAAVAVTGIGCLGAVVTGFLGPALLNSP